MTWKQLPSLALGKDFWEMNAGEFPEVTAAAGNAATVGSCDGRRVAGEAAI